MIQREVLQPVGGLLNRFVASVVLAAAAAALPAPGSPPATIAFGSCAKENAPQPVWDAVAAEEPDLFLFLGDTVYGDTEDMAKLRAKYAQLGAVPGFARLRERCPILGTWDDHDYGMNDAGREFPLKRESQRVFLDFYGIEPGSPRRQREGVYHAEEFRGDGAGTLQVILLDTRYFRSPLFKVPDAERAANRGPYGPARDPAATVLGEQQWAWLGEQLRRPADLRLVATSIQAVPEEHGWEKWANFPEERRRLLNLVHETRAGGVVMLSGDRHLAEVSVLAPDAPGDGVGYPLYEVTSSGLTQSGGGSDDEPNRWRLAGTKPFRRANFGLVKADWAAGRLRLEVRDVSGGLVLGVDEPFASLVPPAR